MDSLCQFIDANDCTRGELGSKKNVADLCTQGKENCEARAVPGAGSAAQSDGAAMLGDNALTNPQS